MTKVTKHITGNISTQTKVQQNLVENKHKHNSWLLRSLVKQSVQKISS